MKRLLTFVLIALVVCMPARPGVLHSAAQDVPRGTWLGSWPYVLPPDHTLNGYASNGLNDNLGGIFRAYVTLPFAVYKWAENKYEGLLAEKWGFSDDMKSYNVSIKAGAKWSDGKPITADDVITTFAIGRLMGWADWNFISDVQEVDDHSVNFVFSGEASPVAERLILEDYIVDSQTYGNLAKKTSDS